MIRTVLPLILILSFHSSFSQSSDLAHTQLKYPYQPLHNNILIIQNNDTINLLDSTGRKTGYWIITGKTKNTLGYCDSCKIEEGVYDRGRKIGNWTKYFPSGNKKGIIEYFNGRPYGKYTLFYENGLIKETGIWKGRKIYGDYLVFSDRGCLLKEIKYGESGEVISSQYYYNNCDTNVSIKGSIDTTINQYQPYYTPTVEKKKYNKALIEPHPKFYDENENIIMEGEFKNGKLINGKHYIYDEFGLLERIDLYKDGECIGQSKL